MQGAIMQRFTFLTLLACATFLTPAAGAHQPHDPINFLLVSPDYWMDGTVYTAQLREDSWGRPLPVSSHDFGMTWDPLPNGMTNSAGFTTACMSPLFASDGMLFYFADQQGMYRSHDRGQTWQHVLQSSLKGPVSLCEPAISAEGNLVLFAATGSGGLAVSDDLGTTWAELIGRETFITALAVSPDFAVDRTVIIGDRSGRLYLSNDSGQSWANLGRIAAAGGINQITCAPEYGTYGEFFVATSDSGLLRTADFGQSFDRIDSGLPNDNFTAVTLSPNYRSDNTLFTMTRGSAVYISSDQGHTWTHRDIGNELSDQTKQHYQVLKVSPQYDVDGTIFVGAFEGLYRSTDRGNTWHHMPTRPPLLITGISMSPEYGIDGVVAVSTYGSGLYALREQGSAWENGNVGIENPYCYGIEFAPQYGGAHLLLAIHREKLLVSSDDGRTWDAQAISLPRGLKTSHPDGSLIYGDQIFPTVLKTSSTFRDDGLVFIGTRHHGLWISDQRTRTWSWGGLGTRHITSIAPSPTYSTDSTIFAASKEGEILRSFDRCRSWSPAVSGLPGNPGLLTLDISPQFSTDHTVAVGTATGVYVSRNSGDTWHLAGNDPIVTTNPIEVVKFSPDFGSGRGYILASVRGCGLFRYQEWQSSWEQVAPELITSGYQITRITFSPDYGLDATIHAAAGTHVLRSADAGTSWQMMDIGFQRIEDFESRAIGFDGQWTTIEAADASAGTYALGLSAQCAVSITFSGTGIRWVGRLDPALGTAEVLLDGQYYTTVDQYNNEPVPQYPLVSITGLPPGEHEVTIIETSGNANGGLVLDAFDVYLP